MDRNEAITKIKAALKRRSGKSWSVTGGTGTAYGWIRIDVLPAQRKYTFDGTELTTTPCGYASLAARTELAQLLGFKEPIHPQGRPIPASYDYYEEYISRAEGVTPTIYGQQYWD